MNCYCGKPSHLTGTHFRLLCDECRRGFEHLELAILREYVDMIDSLRSEEGSCVTICCDNPDDGSDCAIDVVGVWPAVGGPARDERRFTGASINECLAAAVAAKLTKRE